ncbi:hypothetical protein [Acidisphaera sp. L21]|uniref:hypothetical protein n=1 Tax=Acidisphaera sp. L21 TaxID=1641851 RepID=UPI00131D3939|nr:hypothetical protein [Acidisphaera sp. L21]
MPHLPPEVIRARFLIAQSRLMVEIAWTRCSELEAERIRSNNLIMIAREILEPRVQELLLDMPLDGAWTPGAGPHSEIISTMLDDGTLVIEEDRMPEDGDGPWRVRLTKEAMEILS